MMSGNSALNSLMNSVFPNITHILFLGDTWGSSMAEEKGGRIPSGETFVVISRDPGLGTVSFRRTRNKNKSDMMERKQWKSLFQGYFKFHIVHGRDYFPTAMRLCPERHQCREDESTRMLTSTLPISHLQQQKRNKISEWAKQETHLSIERL